LKIKPKNIKAGTDLGKLLLDKGFPIRSVVLTSPSVGALLLSEEDFLLLIEVGGSEVAVAQTVAAIRGISEFAVDSIGTTIGQELRSIFKGDNRIVVRVGVPRQRITEIMSYMMEINIAGFANIAAGQILGECFSGDLNNLDELASELRTLREVVEQYHGYLLIENAPTDLRSKIDPSGRVELSVVSELRRKFDPGQIINPGRMGGQE
jgi:hypothetical protein